MTVAIRVFIPINAKQRHGGPVQMQFPTDIHCSLIPKYDVTSSVAVDLKQKIRSTSNAVGPCLQQAKCENFNPPTF